jgi:hypothetical protein
VSGGRLVTPHLLAGRQAPSSAAIRAAWPVGRSKSRGTSVVTVSRGPDSHRYSQAGGQPPRESGAGRLLVQVTGRERHQPTGRAIFARQAHGCLRRERSERPGWWRSRPPAHRRPRQAEQTVTGAAKRGRDRCGTSVGGSPGAGPLPGGWVDGGRDGSREHSAK